jgi:hypothetical protein
MAQVVEMHRSLVLLVCALTATTLSISTSRAQFDALGRCDPCDFDNNGVIGIEDFYLLQAEVQAKTNNPAFDVIGRAPHEPADRIVDNLDRQEFLDNKLKAWGGDSNWDGVFDTADFVQVFQVGDFEDNKPQLPETLLNAVWSTGDWTGDKDFTLNDIVYGYDSGGYRRPAKRLDPFPDLPDPRQPKTTDPVRLSIGNGPSTPNAVTLNYDPMDGYLSIRTNTIPTTIELRSLAGRFTGICTSCTSLFDVAAPDTLFMLSPYDERSQRGGLRDVVFGAVLERGMTRDQLVEDLIINGSFHGGGDLASAGGGGPFVWVVLAGDFDFDGQLTASDIDRLTLAALEQSTDLTFDVNKDAHVDDQDHDRWIRGLARTCRGDANLDGEFNSHDLVTVFQIGHFNDGVSRNSGWAQGDWSGDREFDTDDFVQAFQLSCYEIGPLPAAKSVPESSSNLVMLLGCVELALISRALQYRWHHQVSGCGSDNQQ